MSRVDGDLACFVDDGLELASTAAGSLTGKTFVAKDLFEVKGHTSSFGHPAWRDTHHPSSRTAWAIETLLGAGATMSGLVKLDQLAYSLIGNAGEGDPPVNSLYPERFTGGSSSGSAAAVAGGLVDFGLGTDTAGSIRVPAAACGLHSLRPTYGAIDSTGVLPLAPPFDVVGVMARDAFTLSDACEVLLTSANGPVAGIERLLLPHDSLALVEPEVANAIALAATSLAGRIGADVEEIAFARFTETEHADLFARLQAREIWATHSDWVLENRHLLADDVRTRLERAELLAGSGEDEKAADAAAWARYRSDYDDFATEGTAVLLPIMPGLPPARQVAPDDLLNFRMGAFRFSAPSSLTGAPQTVLPVKDEHSGRVYGLGLLGSAHQDRALLAAACQAGGHQPSLAVTTES